MRHGSGSGVSYATGVRYGYVPSGVPNPSLVLAVMPPASAEYTVDASAAVREHLTTRGLGGGDLTGALAGDPDVHLAGVGVAQFAPGRHRPQRVQVRAATIWAPRASPPARVPGTSPIPPR